MKWKEDFRTTKIESDLIGGIMKIVDLIKRFKEIGYDKDTEFAVCVINKTDIDIKLYEELSIDDVVKNEDCMNYNQIGLVIVRE